MTTMRAAVLYGAEDVRIEDLPVPAAGPGEVRVKIAAALTCGTDAKVFRRGYHAKMIRPPAVFGHEFAGCVDALGTSPPKQTAVISTEARHHQHKLPSSRPKRSPPT